MSAQATFDWNTAAYRTHLIEYGLDRVPRELALYLVCDGAKIPKRPDLVYAHAPKRQLANKIGCSTSSITRAAIRLAELGVLHVYQSSRQNTANLYVMELSALRGLHVPVQRFEQLPLEDCPEVRGGPGWSVGGPPARAVKEDLSKIRVNRDRDRAVARAPEPEPEPSSAPASGQQWTTAPWWPMPWAKDGGMPSAVLVHCVRQQDMQPLRHLFHEAQRTKFIPAGAADDVHLRFLTACHHCATAKGLNNRMAALVRRVRSNPIDVARTRHESDQWAQHVLQRTRTPAPAGLPRVQFQTTRGGDP